MRDVDVTRDEVEEGVATAPEPKRSRPMLAFLKIWLPFPVMLAGILYFQFRSGDLGSSPGGTTGGVFEKAGNELPMLVQSLDQERRELDQEWERVRDVRRRLPLEESEIENRQRDAGDLLDRVEAKVLVMEEERDDMYMEFARVYDALKPDAAADILADIDVETSTEILRRMKQRQVAQIMASLEPDAAARISQRMLRAP
jgi:flagellar motility protein MotE (MotC chaperone)